MTKSKEYLGIFQAIVLEVILGTDIQFLPPSVASVTYLVLQAMRS